ncbi:uncharacterized protein LOC134195206 [Corticium candelabrum]|uniref:uncharacterized protein LOC134195206 n=1 Tax=Corticium candelabrum TaxID=121492 RepID=UPI002E264C6B|nr:uncharacterized protein LOC134195206 [Corticium candelabrum]
MASMRWRKRSLQAEKAANARRHKLNVDMSPEEGGPEEVLRSTHKHDDGSASSSREQPEGSVSFTEEDSWQRISEWMRELEADDLKMVSLLLFQFHRRETSANVKQSAEAVARVVSRDEKTIRRWRMDFVENAGEFSEDGRGRHSRISVTYDEECKRKAMKWAREHSCVRGQPNMTLSDFCHYVNSNLLLNSSLPAGFPRKISLSTTRRFLMELGFSRVDSSRKGLYIDGHEREDVVNERNLFLQSLHDLESTHRPPPLPNDVQAGVEQPVATGNSSATKILVTIFHDESSFQSNEDQRFVWSQPDQVAIKPKSRGSGRMVSDFIEEYSGYLRLSPEDFELAKVACPTIRQEAREIIEYGENRDGYWTHDKFIGQVKQAAMIAEFKYPKDMYTILWIFDQSSNHKAKAKDALIASRMNVGPGGAQPKMRDTLYNGRLQKLVDDAGEPKGLRQVLVERGVDVQNLKREDMVFVLSKHEDFLNEKSVVESYLMSLGHHCLFLPKYHCELNPIERVWGHAKKYKRAYCNYSITGLRNSMIPALETVDVELIRRFFRKARDYLQAYRDGQVTGHNVEEAVKVYKSHRRVLQNK